MGYLDVCSGEYTIEKFKGDSKLYSWMYRIATNEAITHINKNAKRLQISNEETQEIAIQNLAADVYFDGDDIQLKEQLSPIIKDELLSNTSFKQVNETSRKLSEQYNIQVNPREINLFYLKENLRERIIFENNISEWVKYVCKPNYQELGPKLGKDVNKLKSELDSLNQDEIADIIEAGSFTFSNQKIDLHSLDLQLVATADRPNQDIVNDFLISLNTDIDDELLEERISREIVSLIQKLRKESDYDITDRIITTVSSEDEIVLSAIKSHVKYIQNETLSVSFSTVKKPGIENLLNYSISIQIEKS